VAPASLKKDDVTAARRSVLVDAYGTELLAAGSSRAAAAVCMTLLAGDAPACARWVLHVLATGGDAARFAFARGALAHFGIDLDTCAPPPAASPSQPPTPTLRGGSGADGVAAGRPPRAGGGGEPAATPIVDGVPAALPAPLLVPLARGAMPRLTAAVYTPLLTYLLDSHLFECVAALRVMLMLPSQAQPDVLDVPALTRSVEAAAAELAAARLAKGGAAAALAATHGAGTPGEQQIALAEALVELYTAGGRFEDAVTVYFGAHALATGTGSGGGGGGGASLKRLERTSARMFELLERYSLYAAVSDKILQLLGVDRARTLALLQHHMDVFPVESVAMQLRTQPELLLAVLHHLFVHAYDAYNVKAYEAFHGIQLQLYVTYDRPHLQHFLDKSSFYPLEAARALCLNAKPEPLYRELVGVLTRMGSPKEAIDICLAHLRDVPGAVRIACMFDDEELWVDVLARAARSRDGAVIGELLDSAINTPLDPLRIVAAIPPSLPVPGLQRRLLATLRDRRLHLGMAEVCRDLFSRDVMSLVNRLVDGRRGGLLVPAGSTCDLCHDRLSAHRGGAAEPGGGSSSGGGGGGSGGDGGEERSVSIFSCHHAFHHRCLLDYDAHAPLPAGAGAASRRRARSRSESSFSDGRRGRVGSMGGPGDRDGGGVGFASGGGAAAGFSRATGTALALGGGGGGGGGGAGGGLRRPSVGTAQQLAASDDGSAAGDDGAAFPPGTLRCPLCHSSGSSSATAAVLPAAGAAPE